MLHRQLQQCRADGTYQFDVSVVQDRSGVLRLSWGYTARTRIADWLAHCRWITRSWTLQ
jgi:hypothetical protein